MDAVRLIGICAVVAGHVWSSAAVHRATFAWHVPLFFVLTGYLWNDRRGVAGELWARVRSLLLPYVCWVLLLVAVLEVYYLDLLGHPIWTLWPQVLQGGSHVSRPFSALWFVTALFFAAVLLRLLSWAPTWVAATVGVAGVLACYVAGGTIARFPLSIGLAPGCLLFVLAGRALRQHRDRIVRPAQVGLLLLLPAVVLMITKTSVPLNLKLGDFGTPVIGVLIAVAIPLGLILLAEASVAVWPAAVSRAVLAIAPAGLIVVLAHPAVLLWVGTTTGSWRDFALAVVLPLALGLLVVRTPLARPLAGCPRIRFRAARVL